MIIHHLLILLIIAAAIQPTKEGRAAALTFAGLAVGFAVIPVPDTYFHLSAASTDGLCVLILSRIGTKSGVIRELQLLCLLSIVLNFAGWVSYEMYVPAWPYNASFVVFYFITVMSLIMRRIGNANGTSDTYRPWFPVHFTSYYINNPEY